MVGMGQKDAYVGDEAQSQIFSMSSQLLTIPCSIGYFKVKIPLLD
jgi:hypothetical protein